MEASFFLASFFLSCSVFAQGSPEGESLMLTSTTAEPISIASIDGTRRTYRNVNISTIDTTAGIHFGSDCEVVAQAEADRLASKGFRVIDMEVAACEAPLRFGGLSSVTVVFD